MSKNSYIRIRGAREHNLKNINLEIPRDQLIVITGVSGSGKSSLAFDTIYAEGQRRYVESLSTYARQFLGLMEKPDVDFIDGLSPAISIEQKTTHKNPRSTVGTVTEIYDYLRLLFARIGQPHCHLCNRRVSTVDVDQIVSQIMLLKESARLIIMAPLVQNKKGQHKDLIEKMKKEGFVRMRINDAIIQINEDEINLHKNKKHKLDLVVDRLILKKGIRTRLADSVELALKHGEGRVSVLDNTLDKTLDNTKDNTKEHFFSQSLYCNHCNISLPEISPRSFSFNSPLGACATCDGLGIHLEFDEEALVINPKNTLLEGVIASWGVSQSYWYTQTLKELQENYGISMTKAWNTLSAKHKKIIFYGSKVITDNKNYKGKNYHFEGVINSLYRRYKDTDSEEARSHLQQYMIEKTCPKCNGNRLRQESLAVKCHNKNINELSNNNIEGLRKWFTELQLSKKENEIVTQVVKEIIQRLKFLDDVGVGYLNLSRQAGSLSGGEAQRIRLATQIGSALMGVLYILDEPSIGLHQRDNQRLLETLKKMRDLGNTVIVVEHDEETMRSANFILDIGPEAGADGGKLVAAGTAEEIQKVPQSITGQYLSGKRFISIPKKRRPGNAKAIYIKGAAQNNLDKIDVAFPLGKFNCITGVSGSGKSTLINDILYKCLAHKINIQRSHYAKNPGKQPGKHQSISGTEHIDRVILINQEAIGRTPRSNSATYTGILTPIRECFSLLTEARLRGYSPGRFSFNVLGGRCENCRGAGIIKIEMHFLPDVYVTCDVCNSKRFNKETLEVKYKGANIYDILEMTVNKAFDFFENIEVIHRKLRTLKDVGLGYIKLGQPATTLSGGEAQRVKLSTELSRINTGNTLYILDEPTTGLHFEDIAQLLKILHRFVDSGNTVIVIEHNLDVIKTADHIIDLGPEGGDKGGKVICCGTPEQVASVSTSYTGAFLKKILANNSA